MKYKCLLCGDEVTKNEVDNHKAVHHPNEMHYGIMWPIEASEDIHQYSPKIQILESSLIAKVLGVKKVYIRNECQNKSGSMKDYLVQTAVQDGLKKGFEVFTVVSSGNHAFSLAKITDEYNVKSLLFTTATSSKIPHLSQYSNSIILAVKDAIFEDVYRIAGKKLFKGVYNANVSNELSILGLHPVALDISCLNPLPSHILSGVGNGSYLAGIALGLERIDCVGSKIVPVGMKGAFPTINAFVNDKLIHEYSDFLVSEDLIDAAEGSIATESYSMPQLMHAVKVTKGFPLGGLLNDDLKTAYRLLSRDEFLIKNGIIPEPTGIMGLAAALKHKDQFKKEDVLHFSFTGHGSKDEHGITKLLPDIGSLLISEARKSRPDLVADQVENTRNDNVFFVEKDISPEKINEIIENWRNQRR